MFMSCLVIQQYNMETACRGQLIVASNGLEYQQSVHLHLGVKPLGDWLWVQVPAAVCVHERGLGSG